MCPLHVVPSEPGPPGSICTRGDESSASYCSVVFFVGGEASQPGPPGSAGTLVDESGSVPPPIRYDGWREGELAPLPPSAPAPPWPTRRCPSPANRSTTSSLNEQWKCPFPPPPDALRIFENFGFMLRRFKLHLFVFTRNGPEIVAQQKDNDEEILKAAYVDSRVSIKRPSKIGVYFLRYRFDNGELYIISASSGILHSLGVNEIITQAGNLARECDDPSFCIISVVVLEQRGRRNCQFSRYLAVLGKYNLEDSFPLE